MIAVIRCYLFGPLLNFSVSAKIHGGSQDNLHLHDAKWTIANNYLTLKLEDAPSGVDLAHYDYRVRASSGTGVQASSGQITCRKPWGAVNSGWFNATTTPTDNYSGVFLLRCGFGGGTTNLEIWLRHRAAGQVFSSASYSGVMRQPWHDEDHSITYRIACMPAPTTDLDFVVGIREAAQAWTSANAGISFGRATVPCDSLLPETGRVTVKLLPTGAADRCVGGIACAFNIPDSNYPHLTTREILIKEMPETGHSWTTNSMMIEDWEYYLPATMMHEFGHTAGLGHSGNPSDLMTSAPPDGEIIQTPPSNDISAMRVVNTSHTH